VSAESDKLVIKTLRMAIASAWIMIFLQLVHFVLKSTHDCPKCPPACVLPAEKP